MHPYINFAAVIHQKNALDVGRPGRKIGDKNAFHAGEQKRLKTIENTAVTDKISPCLVLIFFTLIALWELLCVDRYLAKNWGINAGSLVVIGLSSSAQCSVSFICKCVVHSPTRLFLVN